MQLIHRSDLILFVKTLQYTGKEDTSCLCACCNTDPKKNIQIHIEICYGQFLDKKKSMLLLKAEKMRN